MEAVVISLFEYGIFADLLLVMPYEGSSTQSQYVIDRHRWNCFFQFVNNNPQITMGEFAARYKEYGCGDKTMAIHYLNQ